MNYSIHVVTLRPSLHICTFTLSNNNQTSSNNHSKILKLKIYHSGYHSVWAKVAGLTVLFPYLNKKKEGFLISEPFLMEPVLHRFNVNTREQVQPFQVSFQLLVQTQNFLSPPLFSLHRGEAGCPPSLPALYTPPFKVCGPHPCVGTTLHPLTSHHTHTHTGVYTSEEQGAAFFWSSWKVLCCPPLLYEFWPQNLLCFHPALAEPRPDSLREAVKY